MTKENSQTELTFKLPSFEGPLDLLLHLIKQNEMDIYDIPIAKITSQYIESLKQMQSLKLDIAGEYLVMAAMLLNIKSKMLLPNEKEQMELAESDFQEDPRELLVKQLLLHKCYQEAAENLQGAAAERSLNYTREELTPPDDIQQQQLSAEGLDVQLLTQALQRLLLQKEISKPQKRVINSEKYTIKDEIKNIRQLLQSTKEPILFSDLFKQNVDLEKIVTVFLAVLELNKRAEVHLEQKQILGPLYLKSEVKSYVSESS